MTLFQKPGMYLSLFFACLLIPILLAQPTLGSDTMNISKDKPIRVAQAQKDDPVEFKPYNDAEFLSAFTAALPSEQDVIDIKAQIDQYKDKILELDDTQDLYKEIIRSLDLLNEIRVQLTELEKKGKVDGPQVKELVRLVEEGSVVALQTNSKTISIGSERMLQNSMEMIKNKKFDETEEYKLGVFAVKNLGPACSLIADKYNGLAMLIRSGPPVLADAIIEVFSDWYKAEDGKYLEFKKGWAVMVLKAMSEKAPEEALKAKAKKALKELKIAE